MERRPDKTELPQPANDNTPPDQREQDTAPPSVRLIHATSFSQEKYEPDISALPHIADALKKFLEANEKRKSEAPEEVIVRALQVLCDAWQEFFDKKGEQIIASVLEKQYGREKLEEAEVIAQLSEMWLDWMVSRTKEGQELFSDARLRNAFAIFHLANLSLSEKELRLARELAESIHRGAQQDLLLAKESKPYHEVGDPFLEVAGAEIVLQAAILLVLAYHLSLQNMLRTAATDDPLEDFAHILLLEPVFAIQSRHGILDETTPTKQQSLVASPSAAQRSFGLLKSIVIHAYHYVEEVPDGRKLYQKLREEFKEISDTSRRYGKGTTPRSVSGVLKGGRSRLRAALTRVLVARWLLDDMVGWDEGEPQRYKELVEHFLESWHQTILLLLYLFSGNGDMEEER